MLNIRTSVFETNSSSCHSFTINSGKQIGKSVLPIKDDGYIYVSLGEYGWGPEDYKYQQDKLSYLVTLVKCINHCYGCDCISEIEDLRDYMDISDVVALYTGAKGIKLVDGDGYVDHQSCDCYRSLADFLTQNKTNIIEFIFGDVVIHIDNDNH